MMKSVRGVSIALFALLTAASVCLAQGEPGTPPPATPSTTTTTETKPADVFKFGNPGHASLGGGVGLSYFLADADYVKSRDGGGTDRDVWGSRDAQMRFAFAANFRYTMTKRFRWQVSPGFLWTGYKDDARAPFRTDYYPNDSLKAEWLALVMPVTAQIQFLHRSGAWLLHEGVGGGIYRVWVEQNRHVVKDPITKELHNNFFPGVTAEIGAERFLKAITSVSLEWTAQTHYVFATTDDDFPSGFNSNVWTVELRFGANYHFDPGTRRSGSTAVRR